MNYIREINAFYDWLETNTISDSAISLWHALMHINNKTGWKNEFSVAMSVLESKTGLKKDAIIRARKTLQKNGRISFKSRAGMQSAVYKIMPLELYANGASTNCGVLTDTNCNANQAQSATQSEPQTATQTASIPKQNKTKQKEDIGKEETGEEEKISIPYQKIVDLYHSICISFSKVRSLSGERKKSIGARYKQYGCDIGIFEELFTKAEASSFMKNSNGTNKNNWKADFDWMINDANMAKALEGKYDNKLKAVPSQSQQSTIWEPPEYNITDTELPPEAIEWRKRQVNKH